LSFRFKIAARADRQIRAAAKWWAKNRTLAPAAFAEDLESAFSLIEQFPHAWQITAHMKQDSQP
jgi:hypothetical protein